MSLQKQAYEKVFGKGNMKGRLSVPMPFFSDRKISSIDANWTEGYMPILLQNVGGKIDVASGKRNSEELFTFDVERTEL
jgi:hypothetical protein